MKYGGDLSPTDRVLKVTQNQLIFILKENEPNLNIFRTSHRVSLTSILSPYMAPGPLNQKIREFVNGVRTRVHLNFRMR